MSDEINALLSFYKGRKMISVKDIKEFSATYCEVRHRLFGEKQNDRQHTEID